MGRHHICPGLGLQDPARIRGRGPRICRWRPTRTELHDAITRGDLDDATETATTLRLELYDLLLALDPDGIMCLRITTSNGTYIYSER